MTACLLLRNPTLCHSNIMIWSSKSLRVLERAGIITHSVLPWASPIVVVPKMSGLLHLRVILLLPLMPLAEVSASYDWCLLPNFTCGGGDRGYILFMGLVVQVQNSFHFSWGSPVLWCWNASPSIVMELILLIPKTHVI